MAAALGEELERLGAMRTTFVVTGTDTDVGKTVFAAALVAALDGCYWKPVQAGSRARPTARPCAGSAVSRPRASFPRPTGWQRRLPRTSRPSATASRSISTGSTLPCG